MSVVEERVGKIVERSSLSTAVKNNWIEVLYVAGIVIMSAGIVSALASPVQQSYIIFPSQSGQSIAETVIYMMAMMLGLAGSTSRISAEGRL